MAKAVTRSLFTSLLFLNKRNQERVSLLVQIVWRYVNIHTPARSKITELRSPSSSILVSIQTLEQFIRSENTTNPTTLFHRFIHHFRNLTAFVCDDEHLRNVLMRHFTSSQFNLFYCCCFCFCCCCHDAAPQCKTHPERIRQ